MSEEKRKCLEQNNVELLTRTDLKEVFDYVKQTYGYDYLRNKQK